MKTQRQKFEDWIKTRWCKPNLEMFRDGYVNKTVQEQWESWQSAIESLVVELPCWSEYDTPRQAIDACADRIEAAGITANDRP